MTVHRRIFTLAALAGAALLLAACGGSDSANSSGSAKSATQSGASGSAATTPAPTAPPAIPCPPAGATTTGTKALGNSGTETDFTSTSGYESVISACTAALQSAGWTVQGSGGGGWGSYGGGGLSGTKGAANLQVEAGSSGSTTYVNVCSWPGARSNDSCGDSDNDGNNDNNQENDDQQNDDQQNDNQQNDNQNDDGN